MNYMKFFNLFIGLILIIESIALYYNIIYSGLILIIGMINVYYAYHEYAKEKRNENIQKKLNQFEIKQVI